LSGFNFAKDLPWKANRKISSEQGSPKSHRLFGVQLPGMACENETKN